ncbi:type IV secretion system DNA-binding domain-containing protein [bacterium]|nr:type IV secretion system DNA-binding domain-containing protein [bacterium]
MSSTHITFFAETNFRNQHRRFGIKRADRRYHMYILGKTGMGKTTLMENMILSDFERDNGVAIIDPHGDLAERLLNRVPSRRINDVIYFNPADVDFPIAFNILEQVKEDLQPLVVSGVLSVFKKLYSEYWAPRQEHVLRNTLLSVVQFPGTTLHTVHQMLTDATFRGQITQKLEDKTLRAFWEKEFAGFDKRQRTEVISPILNKVGQFLADPGVRNIVGQQKNRIPFRKVIDDRRILIANLSKGKIGEDNAILLGSLLLTKLQLAALSRADVSEERREDFYLYVDECQNFFTESVASMLAEMRKYRLNLILANQHLDQLNELIRKAILGNVGTLITFRVGAPDAEALKEDFLPQFAKQDFLNLPRYQIYLRLMIDGVVSEGFSANALPPQAMELGTANTIIKVSRQRYGTQRYKVEMGVGG